MYDGDGAPSETHATVSRRALQTRADLRLWVRDHLRLSSDDEHALLGAVEQVLLHYERVWRESKEEALHAVAAGAVRRLRVMRDELHERDCTASNIARHFEQVVSDLTERTNRDAKTQLLNFHRFMERLELSLSVDRHASWCAVGVADIRSFKAFNDSLGHATGDRIIARVADLLRREVRSSDLVAYQHPNLQGSTPLHARFGGDEFCYFLSGLEDGVTACTVADRFRRAVAQYDWSLEDRRLSEMTVNVDVGLVCLHVGQASVPHLWARPIAEELFVRADKRLYMVKHGNAPFISCEWVRISEGRLIEMDLADQSPGGNSRKTPWSETLPLAARNDEDERQAKE
jgi:diguanylate cyclase (GGDEF)-like protein